MISDVETRLRDFLSYLDESDQCPGCSAQLLGGAQYSSKAHGPVATTHSVSGGRLIRMGLMAVKTIGGGSSLIAIEETATAVIAGSATEADEGPPFDRMTESTNWPAVESPRECQSESP